MNLVVKQDDDPACGYTPTGQTQYRWVDLNPNVDYYCEDCPVDPSAKIYRWGKAPTSDYVCSGTTKYYKEYYQYSIDGGVSWQNVIPEQSRTSDDVIEYNSEDKNCYIIHFNFNQIKHLYHIKYLIENLERKKYKNVDN